MEERSDSDMRSKATDSGKERREKKKKRKEKEEQKDKKIFPPFTPRSYFLFIACLTRSLYDSGWNN